MNDPLSPKKPNYPWYQAELWTDLEQGDLIPNCPVLVQPEKLAEFLVNIREGDTLDAHSQIQWADLVIMSQTCDLIQEKISQVLLCAYFPASGYGKDRRKEIRRERFPYLHMIEKCEIRNHKFARQIIDFRTIYTLPKDFVSSFSTSLDGRVRLLSPYKEHLSQAFARYFMRVGLPRPLEDE